jgi:prepilin-type N-terminal cleavage/methylation domain-containing protein
MSRRPASESGLTLVELLVTIALMGTAFAAILAGVSGIFGDGAVHRNAALTETWLRRYAESIQAASYVACATPSSYTSALTPSPPANFSAQVNTVEYWDGAATASFTTSQSGCVSAGDKGAQRITLQVSETEPTWGLTKTVVLVKRDPS